MALGTGHPSDSIPTGRDVGEMWIVEDLAQRRDSCLFTVFCAMTESDNEPVDKTEEVWIKLLKIVYGLLFLAN